MIERETLRELGRIVTRGYYDHQEIRKSEMNRIRDIIRKTNEGIDTSVPEEKKEKTFDKAYSDRELPELLESMKNEGKLTDADFNYIEHIMEMHADAKKNEAKYKKLMEEYINSERIWTDFLSKVQGIGPVIASNLIKNFGYCESYILDLEKKVVVARESEKGFKEAMEIYGKQVATEKKRYILRGFPMVSSLWKYCGMDVQDGKAPTRRKGVRLTFDPKMRAFVWNIADSLVKKRTPFYRQLYDSEKARQVSLLEKTKCLNCREPPAKHKVKAGKRMCPSEDSEYSPSIQNAPVSLLHAELRARRRMVKIFLEHYFVKSRRIMSLKETKPYPIEKMGHVHYHDVDDVISEHFSN